MRILFVYPNKEAYPIIPLGISTMAGVLRDNGHLVKVFDTTFMMKDLYDDHKTREQLKIVDKVDVSKYWGREEKDIREELTKVIDEFNPNFIGFSIVENNYSLARDLITFIKTKWFEIPIIVGGIFPTVAPQFFLKDDCVDLICIGEGEKVVKLLADKKCLQNIPNLLIKNRYGSFYSTSLDLFYNWKPLSYQDWDKFDNRHLMKPFMGKMWKTGYFELSRGCPFHCSYCVNDYYQNAFKNCGKYRRERDIYNGIQEIKHMKDKYKLELIWFHDENFLMMNDTRFEYFYALYNHLINLPFFIQSRADTLLNLEKLKKLKELGCITISIGVEVGNEKFRRKVLNKPIKNETYLKAFENCRKVDIRTTANVMIGFPDETEENILETIAFLQKCKPDSIGLAIMAPYYGTKLREVCIEKKLMEDKYYPNISFNHKSIIKMKKIKKKRFYELYHNFHDLVYKK